MLNFNKGTFVPTRQATPYLKSPAFRCTPIRDEGRTTGYMVIRNIVSGNTGSLKL